MNPKKTQLSKISQGLSTILNSHSLERGLRDLGILPSIENLITKAKNFYKKKLYVECIHITKEIESIKNLSNFILHNKIVLKTGLKSLDKLFSSIERSQIYAILSNEGRGKTTLALQLILNTCEINNKSAFLLAGSGMSKEEIVDRLIVLQTNIDCWKFKIGKFSDDDLNRLSEAFGILADAPIYISSNYGNQTPIQFEAFLRLELCQISVDFLVIDSFDYLVSNRLQWKDSFKPTYIDDFHNYLKNKYPVLLVISNQNINVADSYINFFHTGIYWPTHGDFYQILHLSQEPLGVDINKIIEKLVNDAEVEFNNSEKEIAKKNNVEQQKLIYRRNIRRYVQIIQEISEDLNVPSILLFNPPPAFLYREVNEIDKGDIEIMGIYADIDEFIVIDHYENFDWSTIRKVIIKPLKSNVEKQVQVRLNTNKLKFME